LDVGAYVSIARPDHWFKNVFMLLGVFLALFVEPLLFRGALAANLAVAFAATCLVASSNYVLNELLDAPKDRLHPKKKLRPVPSGRVSAPLAYAEWVALAAVGLGTAYLVNRPFFLSALALWVAGILYNVPPIRTKDWPYLDVLSESINNPLRLFLGWFVLIPDRVPPVSLVISYWMAGAFFMGTKRLAEYRMINDRQVAGEYRASFFHYDETKLLLSLLFYSTACSLFFGIFIIRYHFELILSAPLWAGFFVYYLRVGLKPDSSVQNPEKLYREAGLMAYLTICVLAFVLLLFTSVPRLYDVFNVTPNAVKPLWEF
jgi:decaprenyl-phosphate phosphoribosyltransferase